MLAMAALRAFSVAASAGFGFLVLFFDMAVVSVWVRPAALRDG